MLRSRFRLGSGRTCEDVVEGVEEDLGREGQGWGRGLGLGWRCKCEDRVGWGSGLDVRSGLGLWTSDGLVLGSRSRVRAG